jgi:hypothetical protein
MADELNTPLLAMIDWHSMLGQGPTRLVRHHNGCIPYWDDDLKPQAVLSGLVNRLKEVTKPPG